VTLRRDIPGDFFPITNEALAPGMKSIKDGAGIDLRGQPVARVLAETRAQLVQHDCAVAFDDPAFHRMREAYGGLASQIVTPILAQGRLAGILSLHQCGTPRTWTDAEIRLAAEAAERARRLIAPSPDRS
jgi:GAF domain-containing protein